jgi:hypothetical protein
MKPPPPLGQERPHCYQRGLLAHQMRRTRHEPGPACRVHYQHWYDHVLDRPRRNRHHAFDRHLRPVQNVPFPQKGGFSSDIPWSESSKSQIFRRPPAFEIFRSARFGDRRAERKIF